MFVHIDILNHGQRIDGIWWRSSDLSFVGVPLPLPVSQDDFYLTRELIQVDWTVSDVLDFLETCRMKLGAKVDQYKQIFAENDVDGEVLADMSDEQLLRSCKHIIKPRAPV